MGDVATEVRPPGTEAHKASSTSQAVLDALSGADEMSLAQLRERLEVGDGGPTENQLSRALRQLVAQEKVVRPRRGYYLLSASATLATPPVPPIPSQRSAGTTKSIARPLTAAPMRTKRVRKQATSESPAVQKPTEAETLPSDLADARLVEVTVESTVATPEPAASQDAETEALVETATDTAAEPATDIASEAPAVVVAEPPAVVDAEAPAVAVAEPPAVVDAEAPAGAVAELQVVNEPRADNRGDEALEESAERDLVADERRAWLVKAAIPVGWFAITGIALMLLGSIIGVLVGIVVAVAAVYLYRRQQAAAQGEVAPTDESNGSEAQVDVSLDQLGVS